MADAATVSLLRWLRRQLAQPTPFREHLEAAVANDDPVEARRLLEGAPFSDAQRRHVEELIDAWEQGARDARRAADGEAGREGSRRRSRRTRSERPKGRPRSP